MILIFNCNLSNVLSIDSPSCQQNYSVYLPLDDDFIDRSCRQVHACAIGNPSMARLGLEKVTSFDGGSYLELPSFNIRNNNHYIQEMTILVRFKVTKIPENFAVILSNGEVDTMPTVDIHINSLNKIIAGINGAYFNPQQVCITLFSVLILTYIFMIHPCVPTVVIWNVIRRGICGVHITHLIPHSTSFC